MNRPRLIRGLRIAWTAWWGILCVLLVEACIRYSMTPQHLNIPYWIPILLTALLAIVPWFPWKFSLRTLLIATALIAVLLGLVVWANIG